MKNKMVSPRNHAWLMVQKALNPAFDLGVRYDGGGVCPNLFDTCPPFQIDGNFGATAAIAEMLLQSEDGMISLLPALPDAWKEGDAAGLCARGGFEVNMAWKDGELNQVTIHSHAGEPCLVRYKDREINVHIKQGQSMPLDGKLAEIHE